VLATLVIVRAFLIETFMSAGEGMSPTVPPGVMLFIDKRGFGNHRAYGVTLYRTDPSTAIRRGEIVAFDKPGEPSYVYLKRVVGLPGDVVEYTGKRLTVNGQGVSTTVVRSGAEGEQLEEVLDGMSYRIQTFSEREDRDYSVRLGESEYFVLGDNRDNSADSRHFGPVPAPNMVGRVVASW
jgi:signal peptidase I